MAETRRWTACRPVLAPVAALLLAGCAGSNVGDSWQCPIAQGAVCTSVAAADPAVRETAGPDRLAVAAPLYAARGESGPNETGPSKTGGAAEPSCRSDCNPFAWLAGLFAGDTDDDAGSRSGVLREPDFGDGGKTGSPEAAREAESAGPAQAAEGSEPDNAPPTARSGTEVAAPSVPVPDVADGADLREPEVIGRVWIGPFVDADGIYREGAYVRTVIAPAAWRLP